MGVYKRNNSWYLDFYYREQRYTECIGQVSKTVAKEILAKRKAEVIEGRYNVNQVKLAPFFDQFADRYLETYSKENKRPKSYIRDITAIHHFKPYFEGKRLSDITNWQIEKYKAMRRGEGAKEATVNRELVVLRHMLNMAVKWGNLKDNPFKGVKLFKENNAKMRILSTEEEEVLMRVIGANPMAKHLEPIIITALNTGMRKGELLGLKWENVDFRNGYILVEETKNREIKMIPMNNTLTNTLKAVKNQNGKSEYVFCKEDGKPFKSIRTAFEKAIKKAGLDGFRFHDLRHTFASRLVMRGVDLPTVKELMGHKDIKMTMRYFHPTPEHKKSAVKFLDQVTTNFTTSERKVISISKQSIDR